MSTQPRSNTTGLPLSWEALSAFLLGAVTASVTTALELHEGGLSRLVAS